MCAGRFSCDLRAMRAPKLIPPAPPSAAPGSNPSNKPGKKLLPGRSFLCSVAPSKPPKFAPVRAPTVP